MPPAASVRTALNESVERHVLEQEPPRARAHHIECGRVVVECRQDQRRRQKLAPPKLADDPQPVAARHAHVEEQYVRTRIDDDAHGLGPVLGFANERHVRYESEERSDAFAHEHVIVG